MRQKWPMRHNTDRSSGVVRHPKRLTFRKCRLAVHLIRTTMLKNRFATYARVIGRILVVVLSLGVATTLALEGNALKRPGDSCAEGVVSRLYFGQATPVGAVTSAQWRAFVAQSVTPRFPAGFTELQAQGHWRDDRGTAVEEETRIVEIAHDGASLSRAHIRAVASEYKTRFAQQSVLVTQFRSLQCF